MPRTAAIIVNYRTSGLVADCLESLADAPPNRVVVVDNASGDDSVVRLESLIRERGWDWCDLYPLTENRGYSAGNNAGLADVGPDYDYYFLLNPDTVVRPGAISALVEFMEAHPDVGIAGSRLEDPDGTPQRSAFRFPAILGEFEGGVRLGMLSRLLHRSVIAPPVRNEPHATDWVAGASMMIRRAVIQQVGPMDEGYFLYFEEVDYCRRAQAAGWPCWYVPASRVVHLVGQSTGVTDTKKPAKRVPSYWFDSRNRYYAKHHHRLYGWAASLAWAAGYASWRVRRWLQRKPDTDPPHYLGDFLRHHFARRRAL